jgi:hypothetical protein
MHHEQRICFAALLELMRLGSEQVKLICRTLRQAWITVQMRCSAFPVRKPVQFEQAIN